MSSTITESIKSEARAAAMFGPDMSVADLKAVMPILEKGKRTDDELSEKRRRSEWDLEKERLLIKAFVAMVALAYVGGFAIVVFSSDSERVKWAGSLVFSLLTGGLSYIAGKGRAS